MLRFLAVPFFLTILLSQIESSKILIVFPFPSHSHYVLGFRIAKELADRGHQVTMISTYPEKAPIKNYRNIVLAENVQLVDELKKQLFDFGGMGLMRQLNFLIEMNVELTDRTLGHEKVQELLNSGETFDVVILEHFMFDSLVGMGQHFNAPVILISTGAPSGISNYLYANPAPSSYVLNTGATFTKPMNFWKRLQNFLMNLFQDVIKRELLHLPRQRKIFRKYFKVDLELDDYLYNTSLMLTNSHVGVNDAVPLVPSIIEIGGFHIYPPKKLPDDLQKFLDDAKEGVILFSMGSNLKSKDLVPETRNAFLKAFAKIKEKVLWKFETDIPDVPKNVKIMDWLPQQDILAHPSVKAFISHGGLLSTIEAVYHGVPIIGIPVFGDQKSNIANAVANGYAVDVPLTEITEERLSWSLNEILNNPKYRENVQQRSRVLKDRPLNPLDTAVFWIEHVIRHKGAPHLRSAGLDLKWYQREMVDITVFLTLVTVLLFAIFYITIKKILGLCIKKKQPKVRKSKKNK